MKYKGKKVLILSGTSKGHEGYVLYEDCDSLAILANGYFGSVGYDGKYYARKENVKVMV